ncbi:MAG: FHA domain-containing protein [Anaerolineae bacterium]|nr:MAG: FHA domain-containing protein [Anaerolineae bacterium]
MRKPRSSRRRMRKFISISLLALTLLSLGYVAHAQGEAYAAIVHLDVQGFPTVTALLDVYDGEGQFIAGLTPADVIVLEDGQERPADDLTVLSPGLQLVVAVNPGPAMGVRDEQAVTRFEKVKNALLTWAGSLPQDGRDDLSLVTTAGPLLTHDTAEAWATHWSAYQPDLTTATPVLQALAFALDIADDPPPQPGMKKAVLFVTPTVDRAALPPLGALVTQALENDVRVYVWLVDAENAFSDTSATELKSLALQSGGDFFAFSGSETLPDPETYFAPLRQTYLLTYTSRLTTSGTHNLSVRVQTSAGELVAPEQGFTLDVQPPNPIIVLPPPLARQPSPDDPFNIKSLMPTQQDVEMIVEFPDGHPRPLVRTALYVDGQLMDENTEPPFEWFVWDLSAYTRSGEHELVVEAEDSLGLRKTSMGVPVTVTVVLPPGGTLATLARNRSAITLGAILLAGLVLFAVLFFGGQRREAIAARRFRRKAYADPLTQPVAPLTRGEPKVQRARRRLPWARAARRPEAPAYLVPLKPNGEPRENASIPLLEQEITFGTDPVRATHVLDDPSISSLHARLRCTAEGDFILSDQGSVAGTWVNYEPISREGRCLSHGDLIHFGGLAYRFTLHPAPEVAPPLILPDEDAL